MTLIRSGILFSIYSIIIFLTVITTIPSIIIDHTGGFTIKNYFEVYASSPLDDFISDNDIPDFNFGAVGDWGVYI